MLCQVCQQRAATVHLASGSASPGHEPVPEWKQHVCKECADAYFAGTPGMNASRGLICLSDSYRSKIYDLLETAHPEAFDNTDFEACDRGGRLMRDFLREHLKKDKIGINEDAFEMLCVDFFCSHHFYTRIEEHKRKNP